MDFRLGVPGAEQSRNVTDALVNLLARGFGVGLPLTGADDGLFLRVSHKNSNAGKIEPIAGRTLALAFFYLVENSHDTK